MPYYITQYDSILHYPIQYYTIRILMVHMVLGAPQPCQLSLMSPGVAVGAGRLMGLSRPIALLVVSLTVLM